MNYIQSDVMVKKINALKNKLLLLKNKLSDSFAYQQQLKEIRSVQAFGFMILSIGCLYFAVNDTDDYTRLYGGITGSILLRYLTIYHDFYYNKRNT